MLTDEPVSHATFMREVGRLNNIEIMTKKVYRNTCPVIDVATEETDCETWPTLPLASEADLKKFEEYIKTEDNKVKAVRTTVYIS